MKKEYWFIGIGIIAVIGVYLYLKKDSIGLLVRIKSQLNLV